MMENRRTYLDKTVKGALIPRILELTFYTK